MRAIMHDRFDTPSAVLTVQEVPLPEPGPGQVRVRTVLAAVHNHDLLTVWGQYGFRPELPARAGTEALGVVDALGEGVDSVAVGQRVATAGTFGVWAEFFVADAVSLMPVPDAIPDEVAVQLGSMPMSAITLLDTLGLSEGDWLIQNAANGAVGRVLAQLASVRGLKVIGLVRRPERVQELVAQGVERVVSTSDDDWREQVRALAGDAAIRVGVDSVGGSATGDLLSALDEGAHLVIFGAMASPTMQISSGDVIFRQATISGFWASKVVPALSPERRAALVQELVGAVMDGTITLPVHQVYAFDDIATAATENFRPGRTGKVLLRP